MDSYTDLLELLSHIIIYLFTVMVSQVLATCAAQIYIYNTFLFLVVFSNRIECFDFHLPQS